jgi:hypothetical protein
MGARVAFAVAVAVAVGVLLYAFVRGPDPETIADSLPVYPGARQLNRNSERFDDWSKQVYLAYELPRGTEPEAVNRFYRDRMDDSWARPDSDCEGYTRDGALVLAGVDAFDDTLLKVLVHSDGADSCDEFASFLHS